MALLQKISEEITEQHGIDVIIPRSESGKKMSISRKVWAEYEQYHPFLKLWMQMESAAHFCHFLAHIEGDRARPRYQTLVRCGIPSPSFSSDQKWTHVGEEPSPPANPSHWRVS